MDTLIIGAGTGGLFTGALLARQGVRVTVLEKNAQIGGGLQTFVRSGERFETGMHVAGGFNPGGTLRRICDYLGITDSLDIRETPVIASVTYADTGHTYDLPAGRRSLEAYLAGRFPDQADGIGKYLDAVFRLSHEENLFYLQPGVTAHSDEFFMPADSFISQYVSNPELQSVLAFENSLYAGVKGHTPAYLHIMISALFMEHPCSFGSGSQRLADALARVIEDAGGQVLTRHQVAQVCVADHMVKYVSDTQGRRFTSDWYISSIHPRMLLGMFDGRAFSPGYARRLDEIPDTASAFKVFLRLKPGALPYPGHPVCISDSAGNVWDGCRTDCWPHTVNCFLADSGSGWASHMTVLSLMDFSEVQRWENTRSGHRGDEYEQWKHERTERVLDLVEKRFAGIREKADEIFAASPLTFRDWYGTVTAGAYGYFKDCRCLSMSQVPVRTKLGNLLLTGQNVNMHGIGGVPMTAIETAQAILGENAVLNDMIQTK